MALVVTQDDRRAVDIVVGLVRQECLGLLIVAGALDAPHAAHPYIIRATDAVAEAVQSSLRLCEAVLVDLGVPMGRVIVSINEQRTIYQVEVKARAPDASICYPGRHALMICPDIPSDLELVGKTIIMTGV